MKRILVPVDFSNASKNAAQYAAALALKLNAEIDLLHVINIGDSSRTLMNWKKLEEQMIKSAEASAKELMSEIRYPVKVKYHRSSGHPVQEVVHRFAKEHGHDLIVIGTHGASGIKKALIGSNASSLINHSSIPVIAVPADVEFNGIENIVYATSMIHLDEEIKTVSRFAKYFDAQITIVHVATNGDGKRDHKNLESILSRMSHYDKLKFEVVHDEDVESGLKKMTDKQHPDMIALFTHELNLYEKVFGKGITRNLAHEATIPLISYNRTKRN